MDQSTVKARITSAWEALWDRGEFSALDGLMSPDFVRTSRSSGTSMSLEELKESVRLTREAFPDLTTTIDHLLIEGDKVAIFWHSTGTHQSQIYGVPATHRKVTSYGCNLGVLREGQLVSEEVTWDPRQLLGAMGITTLGDGL